MTDSLLYNKKEKKNSWAYIVLLYLSFVWVGLYSTIIGLIPSFNYGAGNLLTSGNLITMSGYVLGEALFSWILFEVLFFFYRYILAFKVYSFIVPQDSLKAETRLFFVFRNIFLGLFYNLCFLYPYLYSFASFVNLVVSMIVLILYANHLNKVYSERIVGHFVFKCFCYPIFVYEAISLGFGLVGVLL